MWLGSQPITVEVIDEDRTRVLLSEGSSLTARAVEQVRAAPAQARGQ